MFPSVTSDVDTLIYSIIIAISVASFIIYIILASSYFKIFEEKGEKGYKGFIPIYNVYILMRIVEMPGWMLLLYFIPLVNLFAMALLSVKVANTFNKGAGFAIGFVFYPILAFSKIEKEESLIDVPIQSPLEGAILCPKCGTTLAKDATNCFVCQHPIESEIEKESPSLKSHLTGEAVLPSEEKQLKEEVESSSSVESPFLLHEEPTDDSVDEPIMKDDQSFDFASIAEEYNRESPVEDESIEVEDFNDREENIDENKFEKEENISKKQYKAPSKTLDEILKMNSNLYTKHVLPKEDLEFEQEEKEEEFNNIEVAELLKMIDEVEEDLNEESLKGIKVEKNIGLEEESENKKTGTCPSCGAMIPRYSDKCLLCGTKID